MDTDTVVADVIAHVVDQPQELLAIELQWGRSTYDKAAGVARHDVELCAIVAAPGWQDSRYRSVVAAALPADDRAGRSRALAIAEAVAEQLGVPCWTPDLGPNGEQGGPVDFSRWIAAQGQAPMADFRVQWRAQYWLDEGVPETAEGVHLVTHRCGIDARAAVAHELLSRLGSDDGPVSVDCWIPELKDGRPNQGHSGLGSGPRRRLDLGVEDARDQRRAGRTPTHTVRWLLDGSGHRPTTVMAAIYAMHESFDVALEDLAEVAAWCAGGLSDDALDAAIGPRLDRREPHWNLAQRIRQARRPGGDLGAVLRAARRDLGHVVVVVRLREAFDRAIDLQGATAIMEAVNSGDNDAALHALDAALMRSRPGME